MRVALIGANGHGLHHRKRLGSVQSGRLVALCDTAPVIDPPPGVPVYGSHTDLLAEVKPEIVIISTPPRTHLLIAVDAMRAGADVLLEKPPVLDLAEHSRLSETIDQTGRVVQVGFQALSSPALPRLRSYAPCDVAVFGAWQREDAYWSRSPWAGRLPLDGALRNPFAHAVMQALAVQGSDPVRVEVAWCRTRDIEVDDTATLRVTCANGGRILIAVTLAGEDFVDGRMVIPGKAELDFRAAEGVGLLENLIAHRARGAALVAPLSLTRGFTAVVEALAGMPRPGFVPSAVDGGVRVLPGINKTLEQCAAEFRLLTELATPWTATITGGTATLD